GKNPKARGLFQQPAKAKWRWKRDSAYYTDLRGNPSPALPRRRLFGLAGFRLANLCRIGNRPRAGKQTGTKMPATIWQRRANRGKAQASSTRTEGGMHDSADVDTPPMGSLARRSLTGSASSPSADRMTRAPVLRRV
ncbi:hypothetical protein, partial [Sinorhizobium saheli]